MKLLPLALTALTLHTAHAFANEITQTQIRTLVDQGISFLKQSQQKETIGTDHFSGEWPSTMMNDKGFPLLGKKGKQAYDSNNFTVTSIHNILADVYQRQPELTSIPPMLDLAFERIMSYRNGDSFSFWPELEAPKHLKLKKTLKVRRPNHYFIKHKIVNATCNVANDADDTAVSFIAIQNYAKLNPEIKIWKPETIGPVFSAYRDVNRAVPHFYNAKTGIKNTGAFLTWFATETPSKPLSYIPSLEHLIIPLGINDVDCVVNANVLNALATYGELNTTSGANEACNFLNWTFRTNRQAVCGVYYPSPYNLHYVTAKAFAAGASCLQEATELLVADILSKQQSDGSWSSHIKDDKVHSTLYALNALLYLGEFEKRGTNTAIENAIRFISTAEWTGGAFFSGGTLVRNRLIWKSNAYTTALAVDALSLFLTKFEYL
jgi:hypothetical protein